MKIFVLRNYLLHEEKQYLMHGKQIMHLMKIKINLNYDLLLMKMTL